MRMDLQHRLLRVIGRESTFMSSCSLSMLTSNGSMEQSGGGFNTPDAPAIPVLRSSHHLPVIPRKKKYS